jgi:hypothetical protein
MISFDLECRRGHRFEGLFKDYIAFNDQMKSRSVVCPICESADIKMIFTGCSIQSKSARKSGSAGHSGLLELARTVELYVKEHFENTGNEFAERARAMHYGLERRKDIYGESTLREIKELADEGIGVVPLPSFDRFFQ